MEKSSMKLTVNSVAAMCLSFFIPFFLLGIIYVQYGVYPFGEKSVLISDLYSQYVQFYNHLYSGLVGDKSLLYSWEAGLGLNFLGVIAYYLSSPLSILILLFDKSQLPEAIIVITLFKVGLSGLTMYLFVYYFRAVERYQLLIFSTLYALMSFTVVYSFNIMWLDGICLLPVILLGVEQLIEKNSFILFLLSLAIIFIANFYISYMVGIFSFLYFIVRLLTQQKKNTKEYVLKKTLQFSGYTLLSVGLSAFIVLPTFLQIRTNATESPGPQPIPQFNLLDLYLKLFNSTHDSLVNGLPNLYIGLFPLLVFPIFFVSKRILTREKILYAFLTFLMIISFLSPELYFFWHGFDNPNWFPYRFSFLLSFIILFASFRVFSKIDSTEWPYIRNIFIFNILYLLFMSKVSPDSLSNKKVLINISILAVYFVLLYIKINIHKYKKLIPSLFMILVCLDVAFNTATGIRSLDSQFQYKPRAAYSGSVDYQKMINWVKNYDKSFYRMHTNEPITWNDSMIYDYKKMDSFNSLSNNDMNRFLHRLGYSYMEGIYLAMNGGMIPTDSLLGFKYIISENVINKYDYELIHQEGAYKLYKNHNVLPLGIVLNNNGQYKFPENEDNPFEWQNLLFNGSSDRTNQLYRTIQPSQVLYENLSITEEPDGIRVVKKDKTMPAFIKYSFSISDKQEVYSLLRFEGFSKTRVFVDNSIVREGYPAIHDNRVLDLGAFEDKQLNLTLEVLEDEVKMYHHLFYSLDMNNFERNIKDIKKQGLSIDHFSDTEIEGTIQLIKDGVVFLSIPYDTGWHASIDGKNIKVEKVGGFLGLSVKEGIHMVELHYVPPGFYIGLIISTISSILSVGFLLAKRKWKRVKQTK